MNTPGKAIDGVALASVITAWLDVLSTTLTILATLFAVLVGAVRLYETQTVQNYIARWKARKKA